MNRAQRRQALAGEMGEMTWLSIPYGSPYHMALHTIWLSIPLKSAPAWACLARDYEPGSPEWASTLASAATLNGKHTQPQSWQRACKTARWMQHLSGPTFSPSTLQPGLAQWIASLRASRVKTCPLLESAPGSTESAAACSSTSSTLPTLAVRGSSFWRTSQASLVPPPPLWTKPKGLSTSARPPASWENWPTAGGMRNGSLFQRPTWAPAMGGSDGFAGRGGAWTPPDVCSGARDMSKIDPELQKRADTKRTTGLPTEAAAQWPTPSAAVINDGESPETWHARAALLKEKHRNGNGAGLPLTVAAVQWPTPAARDSKGANSAEHALITGGGRKHMDQLSNFVAHSSHLAQPMPDGPPSCESGPASPQPSTKRLNPAFGEWLMGWPVGWTIADPSASSASETALWRSALQQQLSCLFNE